MADSEAPDLDHGTAEDARREATSGDGWRFGRAPGRKDPTATRAAIRQREIVGRGDRPDLGNPTPPADVGTGHIGLGPTEAELEQEA